MKRLDKLIEAATAKANTLDKQKVADIFGRMTTEQLEELADGNPTKERIRDILASVDGLYLLGGG